MNLDFILDKYIPVIVVATLTIGYIIKETPALKKVVAKDLLGLVNFEFPATRMSGSSFEQHLKNLVNRYLLQDASKDLNILDIEVKTNTPHIYQPDEPPKATNLMSYAINGFKKYNVVWRFDKFENGRIKTVINLIKQRSHLNQMHSYTAILRKVQTIKSSQA